MAFHLHRIGIRTRTLEALKLPLSNAERRNILRGAFLTDALTANHLARALRIPAEDLTRLLTADEHREWFFYRVSARHRLTVWQRAEAAWQSTALSRRAAAQIMEIPSSYLTLALKPEPTSGLILSRPPAARLAAHLNLARGPETFIDGLSLRTGC